MLERDETRYAELLKSMAQISRLFSQSDVPYIDSRFAEKLFIVTTGARDLGRSDKSFDALVGEDTGVGIKTFVGGQGTAKMEKVAEFTSLAREGFFRVSDEERLVRRIARARNDRVMSNAKELGIDLSKCVYHCLVRIPGGAVVHEEPYMLVDESNLAPLNARGGRAEGWSFPDGKIYFTDGRSRYSYSISKNVLMKQFRFSRTKNLIPLEIHPDPLALLDALVGRSPSSPSEMSGFPPFSLNLPDEEVDEEPGRDFVVLPLYSPRDGKVHTQSGINQWNAGGRARKFGEVYIPVPALIHKKLPGFFPPRNQHFVLQLPDGFKVHRAKICQEGGKALMTERNIELGRWLISVIDPSVQSTDFGQSPKRRHRPYTYGNLMAIGSDSVIVRRGKRGTFAIEFAPLGAYETFARSI